MPCVLNLIYATLLAAFSPILMLRAQNDWDGMLAFVLAKLNEQPQ